MSGERSFGRLPWEHNRFDWAPVPPTTASEAAIPAFLASVATFSIDAGQDHPLSGQAPALALWIQCSEKTRRVLGLPYRVWKSPFPSDGKARNPQIVIWSKAASGVGFGRRVVVLGTDDNATPGTNDLFCEVYEVLDEDGRPKDADGDGVIEALPPVAQYVVSSSHPQGVPSFGAKTHGTGIENYVVSVPIWYDTPYPSNPDGWWQLSTTEYPSASDAPDSPIPSLTFNDINVPVNGTLREFRIICRALEDPPGQGGNKIKYPPPSYRNSSLSHTGEHASYGWDVVALRRVTQNTPGGPRNAVVQAGWQKRPGSPPDVPDPPPDAPAPYGAEWYTFSVPITSQEYVEPFVQFNNRLEPMGAGHFDGTGETIFALVYPQNEVSIVLQMTHAITFNYLTWGPPSQLVEDVPSTTIFDESIIVAVQGVKAYSNGSVVHDDLPSGLQSLAWENEPVFLAVGTPQFGAGSPRTIGHLKVTGPSLSNTFRGLWHEDLHYSGDIWLNDIYASALARPSPDFFAALVSSPKGGLEKHKDNFDFFTRVPGSYDWFLAGAGGTIVYPMPSGLTNSHFPSTAPGFIAVRDSPDGNILVLRVD